MLWHNATKSSGDSEQRWQIRHGVEVLKHFFDNWRILGKLEEKL
jgi:hypothetical protein